MCKQEVFFWNTILGHFRKNWVRSCEDFSEFSAEEFQVYIRKKWTRRVHGSIGCECNCWVQGRFAFEDFLLMHVLTCPWSSSEYKWIKHSGMRLLCASYFSKCACSFYDSCVLHCLRWCGCCAWVHVHAASSRVLVAMLSCLNFW